MATAAFVAPHFIQEDSFTQKLMDDVHRLEKRRAQALVDYQRQASDEIAATLLQYSTELEEVRLTMRDRLLALTLGPGDEVDGARVWDFIGGPIRQAQAQPGAIAGYPYDPYEVTIAALAALEFEPAEEWRAPNNDSGQSNPRAAPVVLVEPHIIAPRVVVSEPVLPGSPPPR